MLRAARKEVSRGARRCRSEEEEGRAHSTWAMTRSGFAAPPLPWPSTWRYVGLTCGGKSSSRAVGRSSSSSSRARSLPLMEPPVRRLGGVKVTAEGAAAGRMPGCGRGGERPGILDEPAAGERPRGTTPRSGIGGEPIGRAVEGSVLVLAARAAVAFEADEVERRSARKAKAAVSLLCLARGLQRSLIQS